MSFSLAGETFGINVLRMQEIMLPPEITRLPDAPPFVKGMVNLRGNTIPIIDLRARFGLGAAGRESEEHVLVVEMEGRLVGLLIDAVRAVLQVEPEMLEPPPEWEAGADIKCIQQIAKLEDQLLLLLDPDTVLSSAKPKRSIPFTPAPPKRMRRSVMVSCSGASGTALPPS